MRCKACDTLLNDFECKRKDRLSGEYVDMCNTCYAYAEEYSSDFETTVDVVVDFGKEDVYDINERYRTQYTEE